MAISYIFNSKHRLLVNLKRNAVLILTAFCLIGCGGDNDEAGHKNVVSEAYASIARIDMNLSNFLTVAKAKLSSKATVPFSTKWTNTTTDLKDRRYSNTEISPKQWIALQLDKDKTELDNSKLAPFAKGFELFEHLCIMGVNLSGNNTDADKYPKDGSYTVSISSLNIGNVQSLCGFALDGDLTGKTYNLNVSKTSNTNFYYKSIALTTPSGQVYNYLIVHSATKTNIAAVTITSGIIYRSVASFDHSTRILRLEYIEAANRNLVNGDFVQATRLYLDKSKDIFYLLGREYLKGATDINTEFSFSGKPSANSNFSISFEHSTLSTTDQHNACVSSATGSISSDGVLCGTLTEEYGLDSTTAIGNFISLYSYTNYDGIGETTGLLFTPTDVHATSFAIE